MIPNFRVCTFGLAIGLLSSGCLDIKTPFRDIPYQAVKSADARPCLEGTSLLSYEWIGRGATSSWSDPGNWSNRAVPGDTDTAIFRGTGSICSGYRADALIDQPVRVGGIRLESTARETISQAAGMSLTIGTGGYSQDKGTFQGADALISSDGPFSVQGGTFRSTSGELLVKPSDSPNNTPFLVSSSANFDTNGGTVHLAPPSNAKPELIDVPDGFQFNVLIAEPGDSGVMAGRALQPLSGRTIRTRDLVLTEGNLEGNFEVQGNLTAGRRFGGAAVLITLNGTGDQTYTVDPASFDVDGVLPQLVIDKPSGAVAPAVGTTQMATYSISIRRGGFQAPTGTMKLISQPNSLVFDLADSQLFDANQGTVYVLNAIAGGTATLSYPLGTQIHSLTIDGNGLSKVTAGSGDTLTLTGNFTQLGSQLQGKLSLEGNLEIGPNAYAGFGEITFTGSANQLYKSGNLGSGPILIVDKAAGTVSPDPAVPQLTARALRIKRGTFVAPAPIPGVPSSGILSLNQSAYSPSAELFSVAPGASFQGGTTLVEFLNYEVGSLATVDARGAQSNIGQVRSWVQGVSTLRLLSDLNVTQDLQHSPQSPSGAGGTLDLAGFKMTVGGTFLNNGTARCNGGSYTAGAVDNPGTVVCP